MRHCRTPCRPGATTIAVAALLICSAQAQALTLAFFGGGQVNGPQQTPPVFAGLQTQNTNYSFDGAAGWILDAGFGGTLGAGGSFDGTGSGTFSLGADSLAFTFTSHSDNVAAMPLALAYTVTGGTGAYAGYTGSGSSVLTLLGDPLGPLPINYSEQQGLLNITPVPEPASAWLLALGALALTATGWRRRPVPVPDPV